MRTSCFLICTLISDALFACSDSVPPPPPDTMPATIKVRLTSAQAPALVVFRDGFEAEWQLPSPPVATSVDFDVHGPFMVAVVCEQPDSWFTWQVARTPKDSPTNDGNFALTAPCGAPAQAPVLHVVAGHVVHAGAVHIAGASAQSATDDWDFQVSVPNGTYDLIATTDSQDPEVEDRIVVQRDVVVNGDTTLTDAIDVTKGTALTAVKLPVDNPPAADSGEALVAAVDLMTATTPASRIYLGPVQTAKIAPGAALASTDVQRVALTATKGTAARSVRHPLPLAGDETLTLPAPFGDPTWSFDHDRLSVITGSLPELDFFLVTVTGASGDGIKTARYGLDISQSYLEATSLARPILDTDLPGYHPQWKLDFNKPYSRHLEAQLTADGGVVSTSTVDEDVKASN